MNARHPDYRGTKKYQNKQAARRVKANGGGGSTPPGSASTSRGQIYETVKRPQGAEWEVRRNRVLAKAVFTPCLYCGRQPVNPVVAHLISLSEGQHLGIATSDIRHPLNSEANLVPVCRQDNLWAGTASIWTGRAKVADRLGMTRPYSGPVPDTTGVQRELDALRALKSPGGSPARTEPFTTTESTWAYKNVQDAAEDLMPLAKGSGDYELVQAMMDDYNLPCRSDCLCDGGISSPGFCWFAMWDFDNVWTRT